MMKKLLSYTMMSAALLCASCAKDALTENTVPPVEKSAYEMRNVYIWFGGNNGTLTVNAPFYYGRECGFAFTAKPNLPKEVVSAKLVIRKGHEGTEQPVIAESEIKPLSKDGRSASFTVRIPERHEFKSMQFGVYFYDADGKRLEKVPFTSEVRYPSLFRFNAADMDMSSPDFFLDTDGRPLWKNRQAKITPEGNIEWAPRSETENIGKNPRYIDYDGGNDSADGKTPQTAWKHHPWDPDAEGVAKTDAVMPDTYIFKRGVTYRGIISNSARTDLPHAKPLRFTSSATYGTGNAVILNSTHLDGKWEKTSVPGVFKTNVGLKFEYAAPVIYVRKNGKLQRLNCARFPNFRYDDPDDARKDWLIIEKVTDNKDGTRTIECEGLKKAPSSLKPGTFIARMDWDGVMGFPRNHKVSSADMAAGKFTARAGRTTKKNCRFYLFNDPLLIDEPGEYYYDYATGDLLLMPEKESDLENIEFSWKPHALTLEYINDVEISNLTFMGGCDAPYMFPSWNYGFVRPAAVHFLGCNGITVKNCRFYNVPSGIFGTSPAFGKVDRFAVEDCDFFDCGTWAIRFGEGHISRAKLLRNRIVHTGYVSPVTMTCWLNMISQAVVAGNILEDCGANGIDCMWGDNSPDIPLIRGFIFDNRVERSLRLINDYGNIESWQVGPAYIYNNLSINPGGIWYPQISYGGSPHFGFAYYLDGGFKTYLFNNIAKGVCNDRKTIASNTGAFQEIFGYNNTYFNNTVYKFETAFRRQMPEGGRNRYLGNIMEDITYEFYQMDGWRQNMTGAAERIEFHSNDYAKNLHLGKPEIFGHLISRINFMTSGDWKNALLRAGTHTSDFGTISQTKLLKDPDKLDFRPASANGSGAIAFVPLSIYGCVGEWNFIKPDATAGKREITDESMYPSAEYKVRSMYQIIPRADLSLSSGIKDSDFEQGRCETWKEGALRFNGVDAFAVCSQKDITRDSGFNGNVFDGTKRRSFDMAENSFLLEFVVAPERGTLISKHDGATGYKVSFPRRNVMVFEMKADGKTFSASAEIPENMPKFQHWIIDVDRKANSVSLYLEGNKVASAVKGEIPSGSLSNGGDFFIGKDLSGDFFKGSLDFLRIGQGSLADSMTTAKEIHEWAFDGPNRRDFTGASRGSAPDAGAIQFAK